MITSPIYPTSHDRPGQRQHRARRMMPHIAVFGMIGLLMLGMEAGPARAQDELLTAQIQVVAQGVAEVPAGDVVWRTVRARAEPTTAAPFAERPLSFVVATNDPLLLADGALMHLALLYPGEAAFVPPGLQQQRSSPTDTQVSYLAIELVPAAAALESTDSTVLQPGQPFPSPGGFRDFDLVQGFLAGDAAYVVPDTAQKNLILVTEGAIAVARADSEPTTLIAGESATFSGELAVAGGSPDTSSFVVAIMGDEVVPPPAQSAAAPTPAESETPTPEAAVATPPGPTDGAGSITVQAWLCPPGMTEQSLLPNQCEPTTSEFEATLAGPTLPAPLILADATPENGAYRWNDLPFGDYRLAEAVLPDNYETYILVGARATGDPITGYTVSLSAETPDLSIQFYNFVSQ